MPFSTIWIEFYCLIKVLDCLINFTFVTINDTTAVVGCDIIRIQFYYRAKVIYSVIKLTFVCINETATIIDFKSIRV